MSKRICFYGECMPIPGVAVRDEITKAPKERDPKLEAKLARVVELLEKMVAEDRPAATDVMGAKRALRRENARRLREQGTDSMTSLLDAIKRAEYDALCEYAESAYAARNPHKEQREVSRDSRVQYPHKPRQREPWEDRKSTTDGASRFLLICQESEEAYAARNPHKR